MELTLELVYDICAKLWTWMAKEKKKLDYDKEDWPEWRKYGEMRAYCPCCEYTYDCEKCPLLSVWGDQGDYAGHPCTAPNSPYRSFWLGEGTVKDARLIVKGCKELKKGKKK